MVATDWVLSISDMMSPSMLKLSPEATIWVYCSSDLLKPSGLSPYIYSGESLVKVRVVEQVIQDATSVRTSFHGIQTIPSVE